MTKVKCILIPLSLFILLTNYSFGQGCSDAGFCTINSFKPNSSESIDAMNNHLKIGAFFGKADNAISVYGNYLDYNGRLNNKLGIDLKLTTLAQNGNGLSVFGLSDVFINANYRTSEKLKFTLGAKIPLSNASKSINRLPLPMDYQASLGTLDLILGVGYAVKNLQLVAAIQQPLTQNENQFFSSSYPASSKLRPFQSTHKFIRSSDILVRISYPVALSQKLKLTPSMLPIYHFANDRYLNEFNIEKEIGGSQGLTVNLNLYFDYEINSKNLIQINMGIPVVVRDSRPDGLTRSFITSLEYRIKF